MATIPLRMAASWLDRVHTDVRGAALKAALSATQIGVRDIKGVIIPGMPHPPVGRGTYRDGWRYFRIPEGARIENRVYPQAPLIEFGVRGSSIKIGRAMIIALSEWIAMKGLAFKNPGDTLEGVAWAIAKSMQKRGIFNEGDSHGFHIIDKAIPAMLKEFERAFRKYVDKGVGTGTGSP